MLIYFALLIIIITELRFLLYHLVMANGSWNV